MRYHRRIELVAFALDADGGAASEPLWRTSVHGSGSSGDLRRVFPVPMAAAQPDLGRGTGRAIDVEPTETDARVEALAAR